MFERHFPRRVVPVAALLTLGAARAFAAPSCAPTYKAAVKAERSSHLREAQKHNLDNVEVGLGELQECTVGKS